MATVSSLEPLVEIDLQIESADAVNSDQSILSSLFTAAVRKAEESGNLAELDRLIADENMPTELLLGICERGKCLDALGHRNGPRILLERLAEKWDYPEAVVTIGLDLFTNANYDVEAFVSFFSRHASNEWLLESLTHYDASSNQKQQIYLDEIRRHPGAAKFLDTIEGRRLSREIERTTDPERLRDYFNSSSDPRVWRILSLNEHTPPDVLQRLLQARESKFAKEIRNFAKENLARNK